jgi:hypothetical protein
MRLHFILQISHTIFLKMPNIPLNTALSTVPYLEEINDSATKLGDFPLHAMVL